MTRQQTFTREQVIELVDKMLENPDEVLDFLENEDSAWDAETLIELAEDCLDNSNNEDDDE